MQIVMSWQMFFNQLQKDFAYTVDPRFSKLTLVLANPEGTEQFSLL